MTLSPLNAAPQSQAGFGFGQPTLLSQLFLGELASGDPQRMMNALGGLRQLPLQDLLGLLGQLPPELQQALLLALLGGQQSPFSEQPQSPMMPNLGGGGGGGGCRGGGGGGGHRVARSSGGSGSRSSGHGHNHSHGSTSTGSRSSNPTGNTNVAPGVPNLGNVTPGRNGVPAGLQPNAARGAAIVRQHFGFNGDIGGMRAPGGRPSDHHHGNAIDVMTNNNRQLGGQIRDYFIQNARELGVKYVIFEQRIYSASNGWRGRQMEDRGSPTQNHMDHPHISFH